MASSGQPQRTVKRCHAAPQARLKRCGEPTPLRPSLDTSAPGLARVPKVKLGNAAGALATLEEVLVTGFDEFDTMARDATLATLGRDLDALLDSYRGRGGGGGLQGPFKGMFSFLKKK